MDLRQKYRAAIQTAKNFGIDGSVEERDGRLYFSGVVASEAEKDAILDAVKSVEGWRDEVVADIKVRPKPEVDAPVTSMKTYTVKPGDTLSGIARKFLGHADEYMRIFDANRDQLASPGDIRPGQVLKIPSIDRQLI